MTTDFASITAGNFDAPTSFSPGPAPMQQWLAIDQLVVDPSYQREIGKRGRRTIQTIIAAFDWSRFAPVVVAPIEGGRFAIIDGQHRTTAALACGIESVPCYVVQADRAQQAKAFSAINGTVTAITPMQLYHARVAAGDPEAVRVERLCEAGGVKVLRYPVSLDLMRPGQCMAPKALFSVAKRFEDDTVIRALQCITETGDGNPGMVRAAVILALADILDRHKDWRDDATALFAAFDDFDLVSAFDNAAGRGVGSVADRVSLSIEAHLARAFARKAAA